MMVDTAWQCTPTVGMVDVLTVLPLVQCLFRVNTGRQIKRPLCAPEACKFDEAVLDCPFAANGSFVHMPKADAAQPCADPYMEGVRRPSLPP